MNRAYAAGDGRAAAGGAGAGRGPAHRDRSVARAGRQARPVGPGARAAEACDGRCRGRDRGDDWSAIKEAYAERVIDIIEPMRPGFAGKILGRAVFSPRRSRGGKPLPRRRRQSLGQPPARPELPVPPGRRLFALQDAAGPASTCAVPPPGRARAPGRVRAICWAGCWPEADAHDACVCMETKYAPPPLTTPRTCHGNSHEPPPSPNSPPPCFGPRRGRRPHRDARPRDAAHQAAAVDRPQHAAGRDPHHLALRRQGSVLGLELAEAGRAFGHAFRCAAALDHRQGLSGRRHRHHSARRTSSAPSTSSTAAPKWRRTRTSC